MLLVHEAVRKLRSERGQATTEYAILVAVIVLMAIFAITAFRQNLKDLWDAIVEGINGVNPAEKMSTAIVKVS